MKPRSYKETLAMERKLEDYEEELSHIDKLIAKLGSTREHTWEIDSRGEHPIVQCTSCGRFQDYRLTPFPRPGPGDGKEQKAREEAIRRAEF